MDKQEFFLLIPAIIYGVAIVDLLKIFSHKNNYIEMVGWGIFVLLGVVFNWIELYDRLDLLLISNKNFFIIIGQAILFAKVASLITPEEKDSDTKAYFMRVRKLFFWLLSATTIYGIMVRYGLADDNSANWLRPLVIIIYLTVAYSDKYWLRLSLLVLSLTLLIARIFTGSLG